MFGLLIVARHDIPFAILFVLLGSGSLYAYYLAFWGRGGRVKRTFAATSAAKAATAD